ncbi:XRE family transcriptional regulator [Herbaspirillum rubrisubalbicans Os34]|uniref:XRE family transcriptional regulator n=2 Tax=Herbaspirillum rubrisubalbicans TaxID=80842 RepID=A0A6M3ZJN0_9BURK|nr:XRE family transcriptional regulator [Herbaspirillum rubrisubalbicans Os34]
MCKFSRVHMTKTPTKKSPLPLAKVLGENIAMLRKQRSMTQAQLAAAIGIEIETLSKYERGILGPRIAQLQKICAILEVAAWTLFVSVEEQSAFPGFIFAEQIQALSLKDRKTLQRLIELYVSAHGTKRK